MLINLVMHLHFLSVCAHRDISTGAFTSTNSLMGHASSLLDCAPPAPQRLWLLLYKHITWACLASHTTEWELALRLGITVSPIGKLSKECVAVAQESWQSHCPCHLCILPRESYCLKTSLL